MDRPLDPVVTRHRRLRRAGLGGISLAAFVALFGFGPRAQEILTQHGFAFSLESRPAQPTRFTIRF
jgi:hypothetical protein